MYMSSQNSLQKSRLRCTAFFSMAPWAGRLQPRGSSTELCPPVALLISEELLGHGVILCLGVSLYHSPQQRPILRSHQQCVTVQLFPHLDSTCYSQAFCFFFGFVLFWNSSPNACEMDGRYSFGQQYGTSFPGFITSPFEKHLFNSFPHFLIKLSIKLLIKLSDLLSSRSSFCILDRTPYQIRGL